MEECAKEIDEVLKKYNAEIKVKFRTENVLGQTVIAYGLEIVPKIEVKKQG